MRERRCLLALLAAASLSACTRLDAPYRFQAPVVAAVRAERLPPPAAPRPGHEPAATATSGAWAAAPRADWTAGRRDHRRKAAEAPAASVSQALRALIDRPASQTTSVRFALATLASLGAQLDGPLRRVTTGADLLVLAEAREALTDERPLTGDLVLFAPEGDADPLVGIVVTAAPPASARGPVTTEFIYLAGGTVRRGLVTPARPGARADRGGTLLDSAVCSAAGEQDTRCLTGKRFRAYLRLDRLAR